MSFVSITRLRVRSWRYLPAFSLAALRAALQARYATGNLGISLLREPRNIFWTCSLWIDEPAMRAFMVSGAHRPIMRRLLEWCDEASVAHWTGDSAQKPTWEEAHLRMQRDGRPSRVNHPSEAHRRFDISALNVRSKELRFR
jgi:heme-degrading monooxygenase HmoA